MPRSSIFIYPQPPFPPNLPRSLHHPPSKSAQNVPQRSNPE
ncbi:predicted protein [Botrytis cinerea T4]|uniref:Uncharacterized protein n=1 Tax=Botryotinia fuckeliana (strain T4) TaxID=999810 RepID=G2YAA2_BOTF4|nr:predicted protein [Botrytis cinerea T4]